MSLDDYVEAEVLVAVVATVAALSGPGRRVLRKGAVYGLAGGLIAGGAAASFGRGMIHGIRDATASSDEQQGAEQQA